MNEPDDEQPFGVSCDVVFANMGTDSPADDSPTFGPSTPDSHAVRSPVIDGSVADSPVTEPTNQQAGQSGYQPAEQLLALTEEDLASLDSAEVNLLVARGIPSLTNLDIPHYQAILDSWAAEVQARIPLGEMTFWQSPHVRYKESHVNLQSVRYTNPSDLFINGVIDTREGTCGNLAVLHVALSAGGLVGRFTWRVQVHTSSAATMTARSSTTSRRPEPVRAASCRGPTKNTWSDTGYAPSRSKSVPT